MITVTFVYMQCLRITQGWASLFATLATVSTPVYRQHHELKHVPPRYNAEQIEHCLKEFRDDWEALGVEGIARNLR